MSFFMGLVKGYQVEPSDNNKDLVESYNFATLRDDIGVYGQRLLLRLVEAANAEGLIKGLDFTNGDCRQINFDRVPTNLFWVENDLWGHTQIHLPMSAIAGKGGYEYAKIKADLRACMRHIIETKSAKGSTIMFPFLTYVEFDEGQIIVEVRQELWTAFLNFSRGFRKFELDVAMSFQSKHTLKMYRLISGQKEDLNYSISELKKILGLSWNEEATVNGKKTIVEKERYKLPKDFIARVIQPCKDELDASSPYTFDYRLIYSKGHKAGRKSITGLTLHPVYQPKFRDPHLDELDKSHQITMFARGDMSFLSRECKDYLMNKFGFSLCEIQNELPLLNMATKSLNLADLLVKVGESASKTRPKNIQGYVINSIKNALHEAGIAI